MTLKLSKRLAAESIGSALLLATIVGSGIMGERLANGIVAIALLSNSIATGAMLFVLITMLGPISGAHFNPAVTVIAALRGNLRWREAFGYIFVQILFGILGVWITHAMFGLSIIQVSTHERSGLGQWASEVIATFGLIVTIMGTVRYRPDQVPSSVALYIVAAYWFTSSTSFANPAVTIARSLSDTFAGIAPKDVLLFVLAQLIGVALGAVLTRFLFDVPESERSQ